MPVASSSGVVAGSIERIAGIVARHPLTVVMGVSEAAFMLAAVGVHPVELWRVLVIPAYLCHLLLSFPLGPHYWLLFSVTMTGAYVLDRVLQQLRSY